MGFRSAFRARITQTGRLRHRPQQTLAIACGLAVLGLIAITVVSTVAGRQPGRNRNTDDNDRYSTFFMGRIVYSNNNGNDCTNVGNSLARLVSAATTIAVGRERRLRFSDPALFETPFLFMNGHNDFVFSDDDLNNLRTYFTNGGFLFASGCCTNPEFPAAWRREMARIFPGSQVQRLPYNHPVYRSYAKIEKIRCLHEPREIFLEGLTYQGHLVAVMCEDGLCCAFSMENHCNTGRGVSPEDGKKLALNIAIYAITH